VIFGNDGYVKVENLCKRYEISHASASVKEALSQLFTRSLRAESSQKPEQVDVLKDISFELFPGDSLGLVGANGAGKSTLLRILSRIIAPTSGHALIYGRLAPMLEIGTGFHIELTGRENIYLAAAILGLKKRETNNRFDEIVDFSGIEKFLDTSVKYYSSGMYVRLAFAIAIHSSPDIIMADEILAVGDEQFRSKSLQAMIEFRDSGGIIIFVSHDQSLTKAASNRILAFEKGSGTIYAANKYFDCEKEGSNHGRK